MIFSRRKGCVVSTNLFRRVKYIIYIIVFENYS